MFVFLSCFSDAIAMENGFELTCHSKKKNYTLVAKSLEEKVKYVSLLSSLMSRTQAAEERRLF